MNVFTRTVGEFGNKAWRHKNFELRQRILMPFYDRRYDDWNAIVLITKVLEFHSTTDIKMSPNQI